MALDGNLQPGAVADVSAPRAKYVAIGYNICVIVFLGVIDLLADGPGSIRTSIRP